MCMDMYRWLYTIEWDVPYRMYYQTTICIAEMFGAAAYPDAPPHLHSGATHGAAPSTARTTRGLDISQAPFA